MIKEAINRILELAKVEVVDAKPGQLVSSKLTQVQYPTPPVLGLNTLSGIVDYVKADLELGNSGCFIHVEEFDSVSLYLPRIQDTQQRLKVLEASAEHCMNKFKFGSRIGVEEFIIALQANFVQDETTMKLLHIVSRMKAEKITQADDDGISQQVMAKSGVVMTQQVKIPNPVVLRPYRTFSEIEQPESSYVFRVHQAGSELPSISLTSTENSAWKVEAIQKIAKYFRDNLPEMKLIA